MKSLVKGLVLSLTLFLIPLESASADNPFPGVAFGAEVPGYTVQVPCKPDDCGIGIVPVVICPSGSAADGGGGFDVGYAKRFCRNSWTPPTSAADDADFRNRQTLAVAAATVESQAYSAANPGLQKCVTWGPVVHANGISTASGGVCANVVGTKPDGTTAQVAPTPVSSGSSGTSDSSSGGSAPSSPAGSGITGSSNTSSDSATSTSSAPSVQAPVKQQVDLTQFGIGRPFTRVVAGNLPASQCPSGYQAATNSLPGIIDGGATECWPDNAWAAYSIGGEVWTQFKSSNGSLNAQAEATRRVQVNAIRALALQQAQTLANLTLGIKRCNSWSGFGESGQECAYIPIQNNSLGGMTSTSSGETSTSVLKKTIEVVVATISSQPGQTQAQWESTDAYKSFTCPSGAGRAIGIDLKGTASNSDDVWTVSCVQVEIDPASTSDSSTVGSSDTATARSSSAAETSTAVSSSGASTSAALPMTPVASSDTATAAIISDPIDFKGSIKQIANVVEALDLSTSEDSAINSVTTKLANIKPTSKLVKITLPNSPVLDEVAKSLTPNVCRVSGLVVQPKKAGTCQISYTFEGESGNSFETTKKVTFTNDPNKLAAAAKTTKTFTLVGTREANCTSRDVNSNLVSANIVAPPTGGTGSSKYIYKPGTVAKGSKGASVSAGVRELWTKATFQSPYVYQSSSTWYADIEITCSYLG